MKCVGLADTESAARAQGMLAAVLEFTRSRMLLLRHVEMLDADLVELRPARVGPQAPLR